MSSLIGALVCGFLLGAFFFCGLAWTIANGLCARRPGLIFATSLLVRLGVVLVGFIYVSSGECLRLLAAVVGFVIARFLIIVLCKKSFCSFF